MHLVVVQVVVSCEWFKGGLLYSKDGVARTISKWSEVCERRSGLTCNMKVIEYVSAWVHQTNTHDDNDNNVNSRQAWQGPP